MSEVEKKLEDIRRRAESADVGLVGYAPGTVKFLLSVMDNNSDEHKLKRYRRALYFLYDFYETAHRSGGTALAALDDTGELELAKKEFEELRYNKDITDEDKLNRHAGNGINHFVRAHLPAH